MAPMRSLAILPLAALVFASAGCLEDDKDENRGDIGWQTMSSPAFALAVDDTLDRLVVESAVSNADWNRLQITVESAGDTDLRLGVNVESDLTFSSATMENIETAGTYVEVTGNANTMIAGEFLDFCGLTSAGTAGEAKTDVKILLRDDASNAAKGSWVLQSIAACN